MFTLSSAQHYSKVDDIHFMVGCLKLWIRTCEDNIINLLGNSTLRS